MNSMKDTLRRAFGGIYRTASAVIVHIFPPRLWYRVAFLAARLQAAFLCPLAMAGIYPYRRDIAQWPKRRKIVLARLMDTWLRYIAAYRRAFPIPVRIECAPPLEDVLTNQSGLVFCTVHCFLVDATLGAVLEASRNDLSIVTAVQDLSQQCPVYGTDRTVPTIVADANALLKMKSILRRGGSVVVLLDKRIGAPLAANSLRLARIAGARVFFWLPELRPNGEILLRAMRPPCLMAKAMRAF